MNHPLHFALLLLSLGFLCQTTTNAVLMDKLANSKICADEECSYALSMAVALDDFTAPDCRFINIRKDQMIYVYSKLTPEEGTGVFWSGSVCSVMTGLFPELQKHFHHCSQYVFIKWFIQTVFVNSC
uniref:Otoraplin n=1 Tax=Oncorhynchus kisutch TaxID=8019 RepID=A0A8C7KFQ1_ONCKI